MEIKSIEVNTDKQPLPENTNVLERTQQVIRIALEKMGCNEAFYDLLKEPLKLLTVRIPIKMDDGSVRIFTGYRAQHNTFHNVYQTSSQKKVDMRLAAYIVGLKRVVEAIKWRGWI